MEDMEWSPGVDQFLAHMSRWLLVELIGYSWSGVRPSSVYNAQKSSSPKLLGQSKTNFMWSLRASLGREDESLFTPFGHMNKMAATPIYGKNPSKIFSRTGGPIFTKLGM